MRIDEWKLQSVVFEANLVLCVHASFYLLKIFG